jgi:aerobic carbon-monoxide dehydrogenase medium subunit
MKPASFRYHQAKSTQEAVTMLAQVAPEDGRVLAGGQSLVPTMAFRMSRPRHLIDINAIAELAGVAIKGNWLVIGACARHAAFHRPVTDGPLGRLLTFVVRHIAHYPIRIRGTFCGSLAHADPASEWCVTAATLGAEMIAQSTHGQRTIPVEEFFGGIMTTALAEDELLVEARLPLLASDTRFGFYEFSRRAGDYALAMALVTYRLVNGAITEPRVGLGGVEACPRRLAQAEKALTGRQPSDETFRAAADIAADTVDPLEDLQAGAAFRRDLVQAVVTRALERAAA